MLLGASMPGPTIAPKDFTGDTVSDRGRNIDTSGTSKPAKGSVPS